MTSDSVTAFWRQYLMDKKEINSPWLTLNFLIWVGGVGGVLLFAFIGHFVWRLF